LTHLHQKRKIKNPVINNYTQEADCPLIDFSFIYWCVLIYDVTTANHFVFQLHILKLVQLKLFKVSTALAQGWIFPPWALLSKEVWRNTKRNVKIKAIK